MADNVSSGIEPPFSHYYDRTYRTFDGDQIERVTDYAYAKGYEGRTSDSISVEDHLKVLIMAQQYVDSAVSKTCNVGDDVTFESANTKNIVFDKSDNSLKYGDCLLYTLTLPTKA